MQTEIGAGGLADNVVGLACVIEDWLWEGSALVPPAWSHHGGLPGPPCNSLWKGGSSCPMSVVCIQAQLACQTEWLGQLAPRAFLPGRQVPSLVDTRMQPCAQAGQGVMAGRESGKGEWESEQSGLLLSGLRCSWGMDWLSIGKGTPKKNGGYGKICGPHAHTCLHVQMCTLTQVAHGCSEAQGSREEVSEMSACVYHVHCSGLGA